MGCATQGEKAAIIKALREEGYQLKHLLKGLNMPKSTYYYEISKVDTVGFRNAELTEEIKKIFDQHKGRYGVRRVYRELLRHGILLITKEYNASCIHLDCKAKGLKRNIIHSRAK